MISNTEQRNHSYRDLITYKNMELFLGGHPGCDNALFGNRFLKPADRSAIKDALLTRLTQTVDNQDNEGGYFLALPYEEELPTPTISRLWFLVTQSHNARANQAHLYRFEDDAGTSALVGTLREASLTTYNVPLVLIGILDLLWHSLPDEATSPKNVIERLEAIPTS